MVKLRSAHEVYDGENGKMLIKKKKGPKGLFTVHKFHQNLTNAQSGVVDCESWTDGQTTDSSPWHKLICPLATLAKIARHNTMSRHVLSDKVTQDTTFTLKKEKIMF